MRRFLVFAVALAAYMQLTFAVLDASNEEFDTSAQSQVRQSSTSSGLTYDICRSESDCTGERVCRVFMDTMFPPRCADHDYLCLCFPKVPNFCTKSADCSQGERCANFYGGPSPECVSKNAPGAQPVDEPPSPSPSPSTSKISKIWAGASPSSSTWAPDSSPTPKRSSVPQSVAPSVPSSPSSVVQALEVPSSSPSSQATVYPSSSPSISAWLSPDPSSTPSSAAASNDPSPSSSLSPSASSAVIKPSSSARSSPHPSASASLSSAPVFSATATASPTASRAANGMNTQSTVSAYATKTPSRSPSKSPIAESPSKSADPSPSSSTASVVPPIKTPSPSAMIQVIPITIPNANITTRETPTITASMPSNKTLVPERSIIPLPSLSPSASPSNLVNIETVLSPSPDPEDVRNGVCVDANALRHLKPEDLVFASHYWSKVLCDANNSCATAGHMVVFQGRVMMMKSYCETMGCSHSEMFVNSPKYKRGRRVRSNTDGLEYTALAAKYASRMEEAALVVVARLDGVLA